MNTHTEAKHTPGPWTASEPDGTYHDVIRIHACGREVPVAICPQQASRVLQVLSGQTNETTEAALNARLISAAPELLEALRAILPLLDIAFGYEGDVFGSSYNAAGDADAQARAAIAKAMEGAQ